MDEDHFRKEMRPFRESRFDGRDSNLGWQVKCKVLSDENYKPCPNSFDQA